MSAKRNINFLVKNLTDAVIGCAAAVAFLVLGNPENLRGPLPPGLQQLQVIPVQSPLWLLTLHCRGATAPTASELFLNCKCLLIVWMNGGLWLFGLKRALVFQVHSRGRGSYDDMILAPCEPAELAFSLDMDSRYASTSPGKVLSDKGWG